MSAFEQLEQTLRKLPGLGKRSAERIALHLLIERPGDMGLLRETLDAAARAVKACQECGNLCEETLCSICADPTRDDHVLCIVERVPDLVAVNQSGAFRGRFHVLNGKLSPLHGVGPEDLNLGNLAERLAGEIGEVILALSNDIESEATCHYLHDTYFQPAGVSVTRIGFGLPSGGGLVYADSTTLKSALESRRGYE